MTTPTAAFRSSPASSRAVDTAEVSTGPAAADGRELGHGELVAQGNAGESSMIGAQSVPTRLRSPAVTVGNQRIIDVGWTVFEMGYKCTYRPPGRLCRMDGPA